MLTLVRTLAVLASGAEEVPLVPFIHTRVPGDPGTVPPGRQFCPIASMELRPCPSTQTDLTRSVRQDKAG